MKSISKALVPLTDLLQVDPLPSSSAEFNECIKDLYNYRHFFLLLVGASLLHIISDVMWAGYKIAEPYINDVADHIWSIVSYVGGYIRYFFENYFSLDYIMYGVSVAVAVRFMKLMRKEGKLREEREKRMLNKVNKEKRLSMQGNEPVRVIFGQETVSPDLSLPSIGPVPVVDSKEVIDARLQSHKQTNVEADDEAHRRRSSTSDCASSKGEGQSVTPQPTKKRMFSFRPRPSSEASPLKSSDSEGSPFSPLTPSTGESTPHDGKEIKKKKGIKSKLASFFGVSKKRKEPMPTVDEK